VSAEKEDQAMRAAWTRRSIFALMGGVAAAALVPARAAEAAITVHKDPTCGCCTEWVKHLQQNGFTTKVIETSDIGAVKQRLGVPAELAACHTAELAAYILEGHVPARAIRRLLMERPAAKGLAVAGMPMGSPGMEGVRADSYDVVLFGPGVKRVYMKFRGAEPV
jgi:hypothetical protein